MRRFIVLLLAGLLFLTLLPQRTALAHPPYQLPNQFSKCGFTSILSPEHREFLMQLGLPFGVVVDQNVALETVTLRILICAPKTEDGAAKTTFASIQRALPLLDRYAGLRHGTRSTREIVFLPKEEFDKLAIDGAHDSRDDVIYLHAESAKWTIVHELAHYYANHNTLDQPWLREGYADYLTGRVIKDLGMDKALEQPPAGNCSNVVLEDWLSNSNRCGYNLGSEVFKSIEAQLGTDMLHDTLVQLSETGRPITSWQLRIALETRSEKDVQPAFRQVFHQDDPVLQQWVTLSKDMRELSAAAQSLNIALPTSISNQQHAWRTGWLSFPDDIQRIQPITRTTLQVVQQAQAVRELCAEAQLDCLPSWENLPDDQQKLFDLASSLSKRREMLNSYIALVSLIREHKLDVPRKLAEDMARLDGTQGQPILDQARSLLQSGLALEQQCSSSAYDCSGAWRILWNAGDSQALQSMLNDFATFFEQAHQVELRCQKSSSGCATIWQAALRQGGIPVAREVLGMIFQLLEQEQGLIQRCTPFAQQCAIIWHKPLSQGKLEDARQAFAEVKATLEAGERLKTLCAELAASCQAAWQVPLQSGDQKLALERVQRLERAWGLGLQLDQRCVEDGWPCNNAWRSTIITDLDQGERLIFKIDSLLNDFHSLSEQLKNPDGLTQLIATLMACDMKALQADAHAAFQAADLERSQALLAIAMQPISYSRTIISYRWLLFFSTALLLGVSMYWSQRKGRVAPASVAARLPYSSVDASREKVQLTHVPSPDQALLEALLQEKPHDHSRD